MLGEIRAFFMPKFRREEENYGKQNTGKRSIGGTLVDLPIFLDN